MDKITIERIKLLHPKVRTEVEQIYKEICEKLTGKATCRFAYTLRTFKEQDDLFAQGRTKPGKKVTKAKGGQSFHNYGFALDIVLIIDGKKASWDTIKDFDGDATADWMEIVAIFKKYNWVWGGVWNFKDDPHFEKTFGYTWEQLLKLHQAGKVDKNGYVLI
jgi:peptidoglycan L-alanyl-D-glutamate endopeptidase CwlK